MTRDQLTERAAARSGLDPMVLFTPVMMAQRDLGLQFPLDDEQAEEVLGTLCDRLREVLAAQDPADGAGRGFAYLAEITDRYESFDTRRILMRLYMNGTTPATLVEDEEYDPASGWGARPSAAPDRGGKPSWGWWARVREAGLRAVYRMPDPWMGEGEPPVDRALNSREGGSGPRAYRAALAAAVREDPRQVDCWAHLGNDALERAGREPTALRQALGYYQTGVAVAEVSLPEGFDGVLPWGPIENRPFHRALHGLGLTWWRLGRNDLAAKVFRNGLWTNPDDQQGIRYLIADVEKGKAWHPDAP